jgi:hypothetical protein
MPLPPNQSAAARPPISSAAVAWAPATWLGVQLAALGLCAMRVMFWARAPSAGEQLALDAMLAVQVAASALLFPLLLRDLRFTIFAVVSAWPLGQLAAFLADAQPLQWARAELFVTLWLVALHLWSRVLRDPWTKIFAAAVAAMLSLGGPLLWYLRLDFRDAGAQPRVGDLAVFGPLTGAISQSIPDASRAIAWAFVLTAMVCASVLMWNQRRR